MDHDVNTEYLALEDLVVGFQIRFEQLTVQILWTILLIFVHVLLNGPMQIATLQRLVTELIAMTPLEFVQTLQTC